MSRFDSIINTEEKENIEFWYARDLQTQLGYKRWENFFETIKKAMQSCENASIPVENHFREVTKMINLAKGAKRQTQDYMLTRYACYLITQNGDSNKLYYSKYSFIIYCLKIMLIYAIIILCTYYNFIFRQCLEKEDFL